MTITPLKVLIVDDSAIFRKVLKSVIEKDPRFELVGTARNGAEAIDMVDQHKPDAMILDVEMPVKDGLETLKALKKIGHKVEVIMFSSLTKAGAEITFQALELGAFDFVAKPEAESISGGLVSVSSDIIPKLTFLHTRKTLRQVSGGPRAERTKRAPAAKKVVEAVKAPLTRPQPVIRPAAKVKRKVVAIGISTGGPRALAALMKEIPKDLDAGVLIVQHMPPVFTQTLAQRLNETCPLETREAVAGDLVKPGLALIAPGGKHMVVERSGRVTEPVKIRLNEEPPENNCRPSVDVLFRSVAAVYGSETLAVIMTGMGSDGTAGLRILKQNGAYVLAQNEETCTVFGMPRKPIEEGLVEEVLPLEKIADAISRLVSNQR